MHRTLKKQTSQPPAADAAEQQARFDEFRRHYNEERPHQALGQKPPADLYAPSSRLLPERVEDPWYDADHQVRRVRTRGEIKWRGAFTFVGEALAGELVGLAELENGDHVVRFCGRDLGLVDRGGVFRRFAPPRTGLRDPTWRQHGVIDACAVALRFAAATLSRDTLRSGPFTVGRAGAREMPIRTSTIPIQVAATAAVPLRTNHEQA